MLSIKYSLSYLPSFPPTDDTRTSIGADSCADDEPPSTFNIGQVNTRSIGTKAAVVSDCIVEHHHDVFAIVESWHNSSDSTNLIAATPHGYRYVEKARRRKNKNYAKTNHGGICIFFRVEFKVRDITLPAYMTFEALLLTVQHGAVSVALLTIYRPPPSPTDQFFTELSDVLERCSTYSQCYVAGDVNIHLYDSTSSTTAKFNILLKSFGLLDCIRQPTHDKNHQFDVFLVQFDRRLPSIIVHPPMVSDHSLVVAIIDAFSCNAETHSVQRVQRRRWALFNKADFISDLQQSHLFVDPPSDVDELFECYDDTVLSVLNRHTPFADMKYHARATSPWYDRHCYIMKLQTRRLEKAYTSPMSSHIDCMEGTVPSPTHLVSTKIHRVLVSCHQQL